MSLNLEARSIKVNPIVVSFDVDLSLRKSFPFNLRNLVNIDIARYWVYLGKSGNFYLAFMIKSIKKVWEEPLSIFNFAEDVII